MTRGAHAFLLAFACWLVASAAARAHDVNMAVLHLQAVGEGRYMASWTGADGGEAPRFPDHCGWEPPVLECGEEGLVGEVAMIGLGPNRPAAVLRIAGEDGAVRVFTLTSGAPAATLAATLGDGGWSGWARIFNAYLAIGVEHILLGVDHLLFVFGLIWIVRSGRMLAGTITAFTIAHSVTLAAAAFGWVGVPEAAVNATIALSIVFLGVEMLRSGRGERGLTARRPWAVAFVFGLLHGFGFADGLASLGVPDTSLPVALLAFNIGVEIGQLAFVLLVLLLGWSFRVLLLRWPRWAAPAPAYAIGGLAVFWFIERMNAILSTT